MTVSTLQGVIWELDDVRREISQKELNTLEADVAYLKSDRDNLRKQLSLCAQEKDAEIIRLREEIQRLRLLIPIRQAEVRIV